MRHPFVWRCLGGSAVAPFPHPAHRWGRGLARQFRPKFVFPVGSLFRLRVSHHLGRATFPAPAASNAACGFPALRPLLFASPQGLWGLSCRSGFRCWSNHSVAIEQLQSLVQPSPTSTAPSRSLVGSGLAPGRTIPGTSRTCRSLRLDVYSPPQVLQIDGRLCHLVLAFLVVGDFTNSRAPSLHGRYPASTLLRTHPSPSRLRSTSRLSRLYDRPCSRRFRAGTRRASPVARHVLATVLSLPPRRSEGAASVRFRLPHAAFALRLRTRPSGLRTFEATFAYRGRDAHCWAPPAQIRTGPI